MSEVREFLLLGVPLPVHGRSSAHMDALQRELDLIRSAEPDDADSVPARLRRLIDDLEGRFGGMDDGPSGALAEAMAAGVPTVDLRYQLPVEAGEAAEELLDLLHEADELCRAGDLLTLATPPEALTYREWFLGEFVRQALGEPPRPWDPGPGGGPDRVSRPPVAAEAAAPEPPGGALPVGWSVERTGQAARVSCTGDLDLALAPALRTLVAGLHADGVTALEVDLTEVGFLDSVGLSVLITMHLRLRDEGASLVVRPSPAVAHLLELTSVDELLVP